MKGWITVLRKAWNKNTKAVRDSLVVPRTLKAAPLPVMRTPRCKPAEIVDLILAGRLKTACRLADRGLSTARLGKSISGAPALAARRHNRRMYRRAGYVYGFAALMHIACGLHGEPKPYSNISTRV